jgi:DNA helicase HerA-like ATPase
MARQFWTETGSGIGNIGVKNIMDELQMKVQQSPVLGQEGETAIALEQVESIVYKTWLENLNLAEVVDCPTEILNSGINDIVRLFHVKRFVYEKNENNRNKLVSVFHAVASCGGSLLILIDSDGKEINYYIGTKTPLEQNQDILNNSADALTKSMKGNFPGTDIVSIREGDEIKELVESIFSNIQHTKQEKQICTISGVAGLRSKEESNEKRFVQGIEKLIDSMQGEKYTLLLIADPVSKDQIKIMRKAYENMYSWLVPQSSCDFNYGENESESTSKSLTDGTTDTINKSITDSLSYTKGSSKSHTHSSSDTIGGGVSAGFKGFGASVNYSHTESDSNTSTTSKSETTSKAKTEGASASTSEQKSITDQKTLGKNHGIQIKTEDKSIKNLMEKIDLQLQRLDTSADLGMWNCSVYCLSDNESTSKIVSSAYQSLLRGENSSIENSSLTKWEAEQAVKILPYIMKMHHPVLQLGDIQVTPSSLINSSELSIHAGIPQSSVSGLPVVEMASFGREVTTHWENTIQKQEKDGIKLGTIYHMGKQETLSVILNKRSLASHTFITGSTGSGKSNTAYQLLNELKKSGATFLVVEPAKGEYKNVFGNQGDVYVYGTNPKISPLLRINPFTFPESILIQEHLDRLVEIFNVCWPMYAAMPAVLKDAIETSYKETGWDLSTSECRFEPKVYPTFLDITNNIRSIIESSEYSNESKGNYKGSLITRLKSLTNGINGMIFTHDELSNEELFDKNVIVDLSRVGSMETKALIMGLLVMKLQEYRQTSGKMNADLQHITVLEEAHNLLKRTSTEQSSESSNLLGKSVEMLANAIAEMRTYGEGFIIADHAPGLLDMSVIRNTNTKIILRLPDESDRILVGKSAGLNDDQIGELSKLQCGVAAVYQNDWIEPVLCKVDYFKTPNVPYSPKPSIVNACNDKALNELKEKIILYLLSNVLGKKVDENIDNLKDSIYKTNFNGALKAKLFSIFNEEKKYGLRIITPIISQLFENNDAVFAEAKRVMPNITEWTKYLTKNLAPSILDFSEQNQIIILQCIIETNCYNHNSLKDFPSKWAGFIKTKGGMV